jgi:hypothetical protein
MADVSKSDLRIGTKTRRKSRWRRISSKPPGTKGIINDRRLRMMRYGISEMRNEKRKRSYSSIFS